MRYHDPKFDGTWTIRQAANHQGFAYTGTMRIYALPRGGHGIEWNTTAGEYEGIALAIEGQLHVAFGATTSEVGYGLAVYAEVNGGIEAIFTGHGLQGAAGRETVPDCPGMDHLNQTYDMQGWQPDKVTYKGKVAFAPYGALFLLTWSFEGTTGQYVGVGMLCNGKLLTGYGVKSDHSFGCGLYTLQADGSLHGEWAIPSYQETALEIYSAAAPGSRAPELN
ncbi:MAG TPA: hypothetical protein VHS96_17325 [Bacteroidia bacterium]|nr:hypothetical protein [Bacteroidia bacterium]